jgi:type III pantothenate kinase
MDWLLDLGNTRLKWAVSEPGALQARGALDHGEPGFERALAELLDQLPRPGRALMASVTGEDLAARVAAIAARSGVVIERVATQATAAGVHIAYAEPARLGVDRFLALLAAHRRGAGPCLVVSVGTALTVDLLAADGCPHGGLIAPSPTLMRQALEVRMPHLERPGGVVVDFAVDTPDALASGCLWAALGLVERAIGQARQRLGVTPGLLVGGGGGGELVARLGPGAVWAPDLVIEGLQALAAAGAPCD